MLRIATIGTSMITDDFIQVVNANDQAAFVGTLSRDANRGAAFTAERGGERSGKRACAAAARHRRLGRERGGKIIHAFAEHFHS